LFFKNIYNN